MNSKGSKQIEVSTVAQSKVLGLKILFHYLLSLPSEEESDVAREFVLLLFKILKNGGDLEEVSNSRLKSFNLQSILLARLIKHLFEIRSECSFSAYAASQDMKQLFLYNTSNVWQS